MAHQQRQISPDRLAKSPPYRFASATSADPCPATAELEDGCHPEITDIVYRTPNWLLRSGTSLITGLIALLLLLAGWIKFPDIVRGKGEIVGLCPASPVIPETSGHISVSIAEGELVQTGDIVATIQNPADSLAVLALKKELSTILEANLLEPTPRKAAAHENLSWQLLLDAGAATLLDHGGHGRLGEIQTIYSEFFYLFHRLRQLTTDDYPPNALAALEADRQRKISLFASYDQQQASLLAEIDLAKAAIARNESLVDKGAASQARLDDLRQDLLVRQRQLQSLAAAAKAGEIEVEAISSKILDFQHDHREQILNIHARLREALKQTLSAIAVWEKRYLLRAPVSGRVSFYDFWSDAQYVEAGHEAFVVVPEANEIIGRVSVQGHGVGKLKAGQRALLQLADYPSTEYGVIEGRVSAISSIARNGGYIVTIKLGYPLITNLRRQVMFRSHMVAEGKLITEDLSLLERTLYSLRQAFMQGQFAPSPRRSPSQPLSPGPL